MTFGHEFSGTIAEVGEEVSDNFAVGDRVCVQPIIYDGTCGSCEEGLVNCCDNNGFVGLSGRSSLRRCKNIEELMLTLAFFQAGEEVFLTLWLCRNTV